MIMDKAQFRTKCPETFRRQMHKQYFAVLSHKKEGKNNYEIQLEISKKNHWTLTINADPLGGHAAVWYNDVSATLCQCSIVSLSDRSASRDLILEDRHSL